MKKFEYKFLTLPKVPTKTAFFNKDKYNSIRVTQLESCFNELSEKGWILVEVYWMEGLALFKKEINQ